MEQTGISWFGFFFWLIVGGVGGAVVYFFSGGLMKKQLEKQNNPLADVISKHSPVVFAVVITLFSLDQMINAVAVTKGWHYSLKLLFLAIAAFFIIRMVKKIRKENEEKRYGKNKPKMKIKYPK